MVVLDVECYANYFLVLFSDGDYFEAHDEPFSVEQRTKLRQKMLDNTTVGFNSSTYDLPMIAAAVSGAPLAELKALSDSIIADGQHGRYPKRWDHIDIKEPAPGVQVGLKLYGGRLHAKTLQDLPIPPDATITADQCAMLRRYCANDVRTTITLYNEILPRLQLREQMGAQYGIDLRSKSDAQIAEAVLISEIEAHTGKSITRPGGILNSAYRYDAPAIPYATEQLQRLLADVSSAKLIVDNAGNLRMPPELDGRTVEIGASVYRLGIGGLHSSEKSVSHYATADRLLIDVDVASYYPAIILNAGLYPPQCGPEFLTVYRSIVERRLDAKRNGDKVTNESLKICINGSFGKLGSIYSKLCAPKLFFQVTITGQLCLLWLIESVELAGIPVVSGNTDGIVTNPRVDQVETLQGIIRHWETVTGFELESTHYRSLHCRDVNNYLAIKTDGKVKTKGVYADGGLQKNPQMAILTDAAVAYLRDGTPLETTIRSCRDVTRFVTVRTVKGGATWRGEYLGKVARWYWSTDGDPITYASNGNKVPTSEWSKPAMALPETIPADIDLQRYLDAAKKMIQNLDVTQ
jgi:hypothetical protein